MIDTFPVIAITIGTIGRQTALANTAGRQACTVARNTVIGTCAAAGGITRLPAAAKTIVRRMIAAILVFITAVIRAGDAVIARVRRPAAADTVGTCACIDTK